MAKVALICAHCGETAYKEAGHVNRAKAKGASLYCSKLCCGLARRIEKSRAQKVAEKAEYDRLYRAANLAKIKAAKAAAYRANPNREREAAYRKANMSRHVEYCRRPEYRQWKVRYDKAYNARKGFGDFGEAAIILNELIAEINSRVTRTEIYRANGTLNKHQERRRDYERQTQRR